MKTTMYLVILTLLFAACSSDDPKPEAYPTTITVGTVPTDLKIGESATITFKVAQKDHTEKFGLKATSNLTTATITINGAALADATAISPDAENTINFTNPTEAGEYKITLKITDKNEKITTKEIVVKVVEKPVFETIVTVGTVPDSVKVETTTSISFTVAQENHTEDFKIEVDTVVPNYWQGKTFNQDGTPFYYGANIFGSADIQINGKDLASLTTINPNEENTITFTNPTAVGEYTLKLKITDQYNRTTTKEIVLKAYSPTIEIRWYTQDLLKYYFSSVIGNMYENLNKDFSLNPLSPSLQAKRIDSLYTRECPMPGCAEGICVHPKPCQGEWTVSGASMLIHVSQEGGEPMQYVRGTGNYLWDENGYLSTTHFNTTIDGKSGLLEGDFPQGFHGIMLGAHDEIKPGTIFYTIRVVDEWGKEHISTLPYKCFERDETIPSWCTHSDEISDWWYHQIKD